ncbi:Imm51 family immunity protein [Flavobacterium cerinum]|uniref:Imm51 family immunity protein n=1 Tax=Flavobacterium cerinum TaxID=2502784 RepID=UPI0013E2E2B2|nr:Imm51 family immunity protein [Flavobacterium cerinum]
MFSSQFSPDSLGFVVLNKIVSAKGFDENGYGWTEFLMQEIEKMDQHLVGGLNVDPEAETFSIVTTSRSSFEELLSHLTKLFQELKQ